MYSFLRGIVTKKKAFQGPDLFNIHPTHACNHTCLYCTRHSPYLRSLVNPEDTVGSLDFKIIQNLVNDLSKMGTRKIILSGGGEPFLHPSIYQIIQFIKSKGMYCGIFTNATAAGEEGPRRILEAGVDDLFIGVGAFDKTSYEKIHQVKNDFVKLKSFLNYFKKIIPSKRPQLTMVNVVTKDNISQISNMVDFAQIYFDRIYFWQMLVLEGLQLLAPSKEQIRDFLKNLKKIKKNLKIKNNLKEFAFHSIYNNFILPCTGRTIHANLPCYVGWFYGRIDANANLRPCCGNRAFLGNIKEDSFANLWHSAEYNNFRKKSCQVVKDPYWYNKFCFPHCTTYQYNDYINRIIHPIAYLKPRLKAYLVGRKIISKAEC
jgi:MoaA/NifB/PqqE/SkfB family radical SAM enzyme